MRRAKWRQRAGRVGGAAACALTLLHCRFAEIDERDVVIELPSRPASSSGAAGAGDGVAQAPNALRFEPTAVVVGDEHSCALSQAGEVYCWGSNAWGQLGVDRAVAASSVPRRVSLGTGRAVQIAAGAQHTCVRSDSQRVWCWGRNDRGQLGRAASVWGAPAPLAMASNWLQAQWLELHAGAQHTCALLRGASSEASAPEPRWVLCWGDNARGQLGRVAADFSPEPQPVAELASAGALRALQLHGDGSAVQTTSAADGLTGAWGWGAVARPHAGEEPPGSQPQPLFELPASAEASLEGLAFGAAHGCAVWRAAAGERTVRCWGDDSFGQRLGVAEEGSDATSAMALPEAAELFAGGAVSCVLVSGVLRCAGDNRRGQLGRGERSEGGEGELEAVRDLPRVLSVALGTAHGCALVEPEAGQRALACWGAAGFGQLGDGAALSGGGATASAHSALPRWVEGTR